MGVIVDESDLDRTIELHYTVYYKPFAACARELIFPNNRRWKTKDYHLYSTMRDTGEDSEGFW